MNNKFLFIPQWHTSATISSPDANYKSLYPKSSDSHWYFVSPDGSEKRIETALDFRNGITTTSLGTASVLRARLDIALGLGLTFAGNYAGSTISVSGVVPTMLNSVGSATAGYVLTSNGSSFNWVTPSSIVPSISGTTNKITKFTSPSTIGDSIMTDDGAKVVIGTTPSFAVGALNVDGNVYISGDIYLADSTNTFIRYSSGILVQTDENIVFNDELGYNYLNLSTDNISSYTFSILENSVLIGDNGSYSYIISDVDSVTFGNTGSTLTYSIFSDNPGVLRIADSSEGLDKVFVSDGDGYGRWQSLNAGIGLTVSGLTYSVEISGYGLTISSNSVALDYSIFGSTLTHSAGVVELNDSGVSSGTYGTGSELITLTVDNFGRITNISTYSQIVVSGPTGPTGSTGATGPAGGITEIVAGLGLTGGGTSSVVNIDIDSSLAGNGLNLSGGSLNVDATNGLSFYGNSIGIGGTISNNTTILLDGDDLNIEGSGFYTVYLDNSGIVNKVTDGSGTFSFELSPGLGGFITDDIFSKGLEYAGAYETNFTTYSLVSKKYVDDEISGLSFSSGGVLGVTAGIGLTGGGTSSYITLDVNVDNGLSIIGDSVGLGGTLSQSTTIELNSFSFSVLDGNNGLSIRNVPGKIGSTPYSTVGYVDGVTYSMFQSTPFISGIYYSDITNESIVSVYAGMVYLLSSTNSSAEYYLAMDSDSQYAFFRDTINYKGIEYDGAYESNFTTYSLVTKQYVDSEIAGLTLSGATGATGPTGPADTATASTGLVISFDTRRIYNTWSSPGSGNITENLSGAKIGVVQKIYHNGGLTAPSFPGGWKLLGDGVYFTNETNIIYAEWSEGSRVEYWIIQEQ